MTKPVGKNALIEGFLDRVSVRPSVPVLFEGNPGSAKTSFLEEYAEKRGLPIVKLLASTLDETDIGGVMVADHEKKRAAQWSPDWYDMLCPDNGHGGRGILFLDELNCGRKEVLDTMLTLVCSRHLPNGDPLGEGVMIIAAQNDSTQCDNYELSPAMRNRFMHVDHGISEEQWFAWVNNDDPGMVSRPLQPFTTLAQYTKWLREKPEHDEDKKILVRESIKLNLKFCTGKKIMDNYSPCTPRSLFNLMYWTESAHNMIQWVEAFCPKEVLTIFKSVKVAAFRTAGNAPFDGSRETVDAGLDELEKAQKQRKVQGRIKNQAAKT